MKRVRVIQQITGIEVKGKFYVMKINGVFRYFKKTSEGYDEVPVSMLSNCLIEEVSDEK